MSKRNYLISGHTSTGRLEDIDIGILQQSDNGRVLVLNFTSPDEAARRKKGQFLNDYFGRLGAEQVSVLSDLEGDEEVQECFEEAGLLYLPGGSTETLMQRIRERGLADLITSFDGIVSGNSAGAYVQCPDYLKIRGADVEIIPMMGIVDFWTKAHYEPRFDSALTTLSNGRVIYALENESAICYKGGDLEFTGNVWKFSEGRKERVN